MINNIVSILTKKINKDEIISPCLFLGQNKELLNSNVKNIALELIKIYNIPKSYIFIIEDNSENVKISEIKNFFEISNSNPGYKFQIFIIENISRFTLWATNSCLKIFEEPWNKNIILLTNESESWILDTILSRVKIIQVNWLKSLNKRDEYYYSLIKNYKENNNTDIFSYFYKGKLEKEDYLKLLENLILYSKENFEFINLLDEINEDINAIKQNNVLAKYIVDKYLLKI